MTSQNVTLYDDDVLNPEPVTYDTYDNMNSEQILNNDQQVNNSYTENEQNLQNIEANEQNVENVPNTANTAQNNDDGDVQKEVETTKTTTTTTTTTKKSNISLGLLIFTIGVFIGFVFCVAGNPIGMFDKRNDPSCISIWGYKPDCHKTWFRHQEWKNKAGGKCDKAQSLIEAAQAFSVMSIIGGFLTTIVALLEIAQFAEIGVVAVIISSINTVATLVT